MQGLSNEDAFDVDEVDYSGLDDGFDSGSKFLSFKAADVAPLPIVVAPTVMNATSLVPTIVGPPAPTASTPPEIGPQQVIADDQAQITSQFKPVLASLIVSSENRVKVVVIPGLGVTYQYGTRSRNQRQGGSGRRVPPSLANT
ncbi:hypothetical protein Peur_000976 [Populus x canadensis]